MEWMRKLESLYYHNMIQTDSDIVDFADEYDVSRREADNFIAQLRALETPCAGCQFVSMHGMYPCNCCGRGKSDMYSSDRESEMFKQRVEAIRQTTEARKVDNETTNCYFYIAPPNSMYRCHITEVPIIKKVTDMLERNGYAKYKEDVPHWGFCDTVEGAFNLNRDWIEVGPIECGVEFGGVYPVNWNMKDVAEFEMLANSGQIIVQVYWVKDDGRWVLNH